MRESRLLRSSSRPFVRSLEAKAVLSLISRFRSFPLQSGQQGYPDAVTARDREGIEATDLPSCQCCTGMKWLASKVLLKTFCASLCRYVSDRRHAGRRPSSSSSSVPPIPSFVDIRYRGSTKPHSILGTAAGNVVTTAAPHLADFLDKSRSTSCGDRRAKRRGFHLQPLVAKVEERLPENDSSPVERGCGTKIKSRQWRRGGEGREKQARE